MTINMELLFDKVKDLIASDFPVREIAPILEETTLLEILNKLGTSDLPIIPVINKENEYIGIITLRDLLFLFKRRHSTLQEAISHQNIASKTTASDLININLPIIYDEDSLQRITKIMSNFQSTVLPRASKRNEQITGLIYMKDVFTEIRNIIRKIASEGEKDDGH
ncbi:MAG: CBS domain-containing protein [Candidatus Heimdallarchaeota archaeon]